ncbi:MAG: hypothetical protein ACOYBO_01120 [Azonexus sp.]
MANDKTLELKLIARDMMSAVIKDAQKAMGGLADAVKDSALSAAGAWPKFSAGFTTTIDDIRQSVGQFQDILGTMKQAWDFAKEGAENERIANSFQATADSVGVDAQRMADALNKAARGTVDDEVFMQTASRNMALGMATDLKSNVALMELARSASIKFGGSTEDAFEGISTAVGNLQTRQLKQYGLIVDTKTANETYAKALGKTADALTEAEQRTALLNAVMEKSKVVFGDVSNQALTTAEKFTAFEVKVGNLADVAKETAVDAFTPYLDNLTFLETLTDANATESDKLRAAYESLRSRGIDPNSSAMELLRQKIEAADAATKAIAMTTTEQAVRANMAQVKSLDAVEKQSQYTRDGLKAYYESTRMNSEASKEFAKWLQEGVTAKMTDLKTAMAGAIKNENREYVAQQDDLATKAAKLRDEIEKLNASQGRAVTTTSQASMTDAERAAVQGRLAVVTEDLALQQRKKNETDIEFASRMATNAATAETLTGKLNGAAQAVTSYVDNSKKIKELTGEYDTINAEIEANAAKHEDATKRIMAGYLDQAIAAKVAEGKMTSTEGYEASLTVATQLGLISAEDATAIGKMGTALDTALFNKNWNGLGSAIEDALHPKVIAPPVADSYANMYDASRKGYVAPKVDTTSIDVAQAKFDALSISTAARNFPIDFLPITQALGEGITSTKNVQIALDQLTGVPASMRVTPPMKEIITQVNSAKTSADLLRGALDQIKSKSVVIKVNYETSGMQPRAAGGSAFAGSPYWVGEHGPEPFVPAVDGRVLSRRDAMDALSRGGTGGGAAPVINVSIAATMTSDQNIEETAWRVSEIIGSRLRAYQ